MRIAKRQTFVLSLFKQTQGHIFVNLEKGERTMTCKDCIHFDVCTKPYYGETLACNDVNERCVNFKNKADYEEVKHSRWENISGFDVCNICGTSPAYCEPEPNNPKGYSPYCHNCGAKMDGERKRSN
jgi:hypothetical protein